MATNYNLKFYKGGDQPQDAGSIWFKDGVLSVIGINGKPEYFSGVRDVEWTVGEVTEEGKTYVKKVLSLTKADGTKVDLDFSDVASAQVLGALRTELDSLKTTVESNKTAAENGIKEAKDAAADALAAAGTAETNAKAYTDEKIGSYAVEGDEASGLRKEIAERDAAVEGKVTALGQTVSSHDDAIKGIQEELEGLNGGAGSIATQIDNAIKELNNNGVEGEGDYVKVTVTQVEGIVTDVAVVEDLSAITEAISSEAETARAAEKVNADAIAAEKARIDILVGAKDEEGNFVDAGKSVRTIANEELAAQLIGENADEALDTLKEIADWIQQHPEDAAAMNTAIEKNATDITNITKENGTIDTKVAAAEGRVDEKLKDYAKTSEVEDALKAYSTTEQMNAAIKVVGDKADANATAIEDITKDGGAIANAISAAEGRVAETYATKQALTDGLAGKVDNDAFTTYQGTVTEALAGKATVAAVEKNAKDIADIKSALCWERFE